MYLFFGRSSSEIAFRAHCIVRHFPNECNATNRNATNQMLAVSAAPMELILCFAVYTPRVLFVPTALSPPWALQECRACGTHNTAEF